MIGAYVVALSRDHVVQRDSFSHPLAFELTQERYAWTVLLAFIAVFAAIGPFVAAASFGPWIRHAVYGAVAGIATVIGAVLGIAHLRDEQQFHSIKGGWGMRSDFALRIGIPLGLLAGSAAGLALGKRTRRVPGARVEVDGAFHSKKM
ncbi:MAG: hypothetical protein ACT4QC_15720 [Planctomycetaceae bacterium]